MSHPPDNLPDQVRAACKTLTRQGKAVTFPKIAEQTGVSRATLYRRRVLREIVDAYRNPAGEALTITGLATQLDQLRQVLAALADNVRRHEEDLRTLKRARNK
jgi:AcrR family transcriptional regulator